MQNAERSKALCSTNYTNDSLLNLSVYSATIAIAMTFFIILSLDPSSYREGGCIRHEYHAKCTKQEI